MHPVVRFAVLAVLLASAALGAADAPAAPAQALIDQAIQKAKAENKAIFVHFSASW